MLTHNLHATPTRGLLRVDFCEGVAFRSKIRKYPYDENVYLCAATTHAHGVANARASAHLVSRMNLT